MNFLLWGYVLSTLSGVNYFLTMRGYKAGLWMGVANQIVWTCYSLFTKQYGFLFSVALFSFINVYGLIKWDTRKTKEEGE